MDGVARAAGSGVSIEFNGRTLILAPLSLKDFGLIENHLLSQQLNPLDLVKVVVKDLPPELAAGLLRDAYKDAKQMNMISAAAVAEWIDTFDGMAYTMWVCLNKTYPNEFELADVVQIMQELTEDELERMKNLRDQASGIDELGNSTGETDS